MKQAIFLLFFCFSLFFGLIGSAQQSGPSFEGSTAFDYDYDAQFQGTARDSLVTWQEQVLLHTDKSVVSPKEPIFFKAYVLTGPEQLRVSASKVLKVELLDSKGELVDRQYHKIENGAVSGSFIVPKKTDKGNHYLRAYTRWMLNYEPENFALKEIEIQGKKLNPESYEVNDGSISLFPEGGNLIAGLENKVAVQFRNPNNQKIRVVDQDGAHVAAIKDFGMNVGTFLITPQKDKEYSLQFEDGKKVDVPKALNSGYALRLNTISNKKLIVKITATDDLKGQKVYLRGRINGVNYFESEVNLQGKDFVEIDIPKSELPNGVIRLQLEDDFEQVWASRPLFVDNQKLRIHVNRKSEGGSQFLKIKVEDEDGIPIKTELSAALTKDFQVDSNLSYGNDRRAQRFMNDLLVSTGQLPDYALDKISELPDEISYNFQSGLEFYGRAYDLNNVLLANTKIQILINSQDEALAREVTTNNEGNFYLSDLQIEGEAQMVFRTKNDDTSTRLVKVIPLDYETPPLVSVAGDHEDKRYGPPKVLKEFVQEGLIALEGVTMAEEKIRKESMPPVYGIRPRRSVRQDPKRPKLLSELFFELPGLIVGGNADAPTISTLRGGSPGTMGPNTFGSVLDQPGPLWVVDGFPLGNSPGLDPSWGISAIDIDRIGFDAYSGDTSMWGSRAAMGVVYIYTRNGSEYDFIDRKEAQLEFNGYHESIKFEEYLNSLDTKKEISGNSTLYWNPTLKTDKNGEALIQLPEIEDQEEFSLDIKAITQDGKRGSVKMRL